MPETRKRCPKCKRQFRRPTASKRIYCETCRPPRTRPLPIEPTGPHVPGELETATRERLEAADRLGAVEGIAAIQLARALDEASHPLSQRAAATARLFDVLGLALKGTAMREPDELDELAARRQARAS